MTTNYEFASNIAMVAMALAIIGLIVYIMYSHTNTPAATTTTSNMLISGQWAYFDQDIQLYTITQSDENTTRYNLVYNFNTDLTRPNTGYILMPTSLNGSIYNSRTSSLIGSVTFDPVLQTLDIKYNRPTGFFDATLHRFVNDEVNMAASNTFVGIWRQVTTVDRSNQGRYSTSFVGARINLSTIINKIAILGGSVDLLAIDYPITYDNNNYNGNPVTPVDNDVILYIRKFGGSSQYYVLICNSAGTAIVYNSQNILLTILVPLVNNKLTFAAYGMNFVISMLQSSALTNDGVINTDIVANSITTLTLTDNVTSTRTFVKTSQSLI